MRRSDLNIANLSQCYGCFCEEKVSCEDSQLIAEDGINLKEGELRVDGTLLEDMHSLTVLPVLSQRDPKHHRELS